MAATLITGILLDTTVLIDISRGHLDASDFIDSMVQSHTPLFISVVSAMEFVAGCRNQREVDKIQQLIVDFSLLPLSPVASLKAYELMISYSKSHGLSIPDALIAATAMTQQLELATDNERHFKMIPTLLVKRPY